MDNKNKMMMTALIAFMVGLLVGLAVILFATQAKAGSHNILQSVQNDRHGSIVYDKETGVEYYQSETYGSYGTLTLLVNADGTPKLYK